MAIEGSLEFFQLPEILQVIAHQNKTGILTVQGEADIVAISFEAGKVVAADSLSQTLEDALGEVLAGQGLVSPTDFATVAMEHQQGKGRLIDLLVEQGYVGRGELMAALQLHTYRLLIDLLSWNKGEFKFYSGDEVSYEEGFPPIDIDQLLIRSVEEAAGQGHPTIPDARSLYAPVEPPPGVLRVRKEGEERPPSGDGISLTTQEKQLLDQLADGRTVAELTGLHKGDEYKVRYALHRLLELGVARGRPLMSLSPSPQDPVPSVSEGAGLDAFPGALPSSQPMSYAPPAPSGAIDLPLGAPDAASAASTSAEGPSTFGPELRSGRWETSGEHAEMVAVWLGRILALLPAGILFALLLLSPLHLILPMPWQDTERDLLEGAMRHATYERIRRAATTYFLLESRFPDQLSELERAGLISADEQHDPQRRPLAWRPEELAYEIGPLVDGKPLPGTSATGAITGNFLLDPDSLGTGDAGGVPPLVLLD